MTQVIYDKKATSEKYEISISSEKQYGYFEHNYFGDELGGGLWFENNELVDYDGVYTLSEEVIEKIESLGFVVEDSFKEEETAF